MRNARWELSQRDDIRPVVRSGLKSVIFFALLGKNDRFSVFLGLLGEFCLGLAVGGLLLGEFCLGLAVGGLLLGELFRAGMPRGCCWANFLAPRRRQTPPQSADDGLLFGHADDAGALAKGEGRRHRHGAGAPREHEEDEDVLGADRQNRGNAGG